MNRTYVHRLDAIDEILDTLNTLVQEDEEAVDLLFEGGRRGDKEAVDILFEGGRRGDEEAVDLLFEGGRRREEEAVYLLFEGGRRGEEEAVDLLFEGEERRRRWISSLKEVIESQLIVSFSSFC
ncbi:hypothetical protein NHX12_015647 [Muraenolepis orangiensis]|uniref:Uncharacterized protein n=1 Tax=Muraenolepis orangiensis TaxID=630683 RepID=A0A9Q0D8C0_9TELE|nr:hypothetical protein NHX12_015647 [Muraenolepis orangiensis]